MDPDVYRVAFRSMETPALIADTDFVVRDVNEGGLAFTGYDYDELVGQPAAVLATDEDIYDAIVETLSNDEPWQGEFKLLTREGRTVFGQGSVTPVFLDGEKWGYVAVFLDTTKQRRYENTSEVLNRLLRHDLRNDLNVLYGFVQQAELRDDEQVVSAYLERALEKISEVVNKAERARNLREMLERSYDADNRPVRLDHTLNDALVDAMETFDGAEFRFDAIPSVGVLADDLLAVAFEAVLENAVVHNDEDTPVVEVAVEVRESDVLVRVADNGPGIPDGQEDVIFGREERDQVHHGSGISLFFVDNVLKSYDGDIRVEDGNPEGAVFTIRLKRV